MSRLLVIEVLSGSVVSVSFDTGEPLDVSVAVVDHNDKRVYRIGEAEDGGGEEIVALSKGEGYTDEDDESDNEPQGCSHCFNPSFACACSKEEEDNEPQGCRHCSKIDGCACKGGVGRQTPVEVIK